MLAKLPLGNSLIATQVVTPFLTPFKLAAVTAVFMAMPYLLWQAWSFIAPGLYQHEKRFAYPMLVMSIVLFYAGVAFAYFVALPITFGFITRTAPDGVAVMTDIASYLDFTLTVFFAFGLAFQIPVLTVLLAWAGITTPQAMARARPYVLVGAFTVGMLLTPPDVFFPRLCSPCRPICFMKWASSWLASWSPAPARWMRSARILPEGADPIPASRYE